MSVMDFESVVKAYADTVYRVALNILKNPEDSKDCMQNVFLRYYKKQNTFQSCEHIKAWLIRVAVNESKRLLRYSSKAEFVPLEEVANTLFAENKDDKAIFGEVMKLSEKYRTVILLYYYEGYDTKEIAHILKRNEATVRTQLSRARELLKSKLKEDFYE
ncbi:MAG: sigma-70 family RNA polymerase sigma factor [Clostridia bacterium]|nr:sigma-70 family RNA polymerase sigma factor [Clostridia bacterium]